jgi:hypothetical protein
MNPIPPEQNIVRALATDDEERSQEGFAYYSQIHVKNALCFQCLAIEVAPGFLKNDWSQPKIKLSYW